MWDLSSPIRNWTRVPCVGRWIPNHCTTKEVAFLSFISLFLLPLPFLLFSSLISLSHSLPSFFLHLFLRNIMILLYRRRNTRTQVLKQKSQSVARTNPPSGWMRPFWTFQPFQLPSDHPHSSVLRQDESRSTSRCCCSVTKSCQTLDPRDWSLPGFAVLH